jgi:2,3-bisphosphoglycerate-dependent phosphoglycerate mutase
MRIADRLATVAPVAIYSSPYARARQTVEPLALRLELKITEIPDLRERALSSGPLEDFESALHATWDDFSLIHPGGESSSDAQKRAVAVIDTLLARHGDGHIVVSTHGNLLSLLLNHYDPSLEFDFWKSLSMPDVYTLRLQSGGGAAIDRFWD